MLHKVSQIVLNIIAAPFTAMVIVLFSPLIVIGAIIMTASNQLVAITSNPRVARFVDRAFPDNPKG